MSIHFFSQPRSKFLGPLRLDSSYRLPIFAITMPIGLCAGKYAAYYVRDHNFHPLAQPNRSTIRNTHRMYNYLFSSSRKYFMKVVLLDSFLSALHMEVHLHTMPCSIPREGSNIEEVILSIARVCLLAYCIDKFRKIFYRVVRIFPFKRSK